MSAGQVRIPYSVRGQTLVEYLTRDQCPPNLARQCPAVKGCVRAVADQILTVHLQRRAAAHLDQRGCVAVARRDSAYQNLQYCVRSSVDDGQKLQH